MNKNSNSFEFEGKTVTEAIKKALKELGVKREEIRIEILREEEKGLFGMPGAKPAKIKITLLKNKHLDSSQN
ncbi:MAG: Jag N-terminal domain-containing protein [Candidatus Omnitrophica bacterium]|nr:Jag N-terminal domain-containing protein [Candidatus Omnitrophota bacterium]